MCLSTTLDSYVAILTSFRNFANLKWNLIITVNTPRKHNLSPGERIFSRLCLLWKLASGVSLTSPFSTLLSWWILYVSFALYAFEVASKASRYFRKFSPNVYLQKIEWRKLSNLGRQISAHYFRWGFGIDLGNGFLSDALPRVTGATSNESSTFTVATAMLGCSRSVCTRCMTITTEVSTRRMSSSIMWSANCVGVRIRNFSLQLLLQPQLSSLSVEIGFHQPLLCHFAPYYMCPLLCQGTFGYYW